LIQEIYEALPKNTVLYIKPNPKSKYELTEELITYVDQQENIKIIHHSVKMDTILPIIDLVITVTGTIAIECILSNKPIVTLIKTINNLADNCMYIRDLKKDLKNIISLVEMREFKILNEQEKINYINILNTTSYRGKVSDPFTDKNSVSKKNIDNLVLAFYTVIENNE
jgi:lipid A disaccharide synthetase